MVIFSSNASNSIYWRIFIFRGFRRKKYSSNSLRHNKGNYALGANHTLLRGF